MFLAWIHGFPSGPLVSFHSPKTCGLNQVATLSCSYVWMVVCLCFGTPLWWICDQSRVYPALPSQSVGTGSSFTASCNRYSGVESQGVSWESEWEFRFWFSLANHGSLNFIKIPSSHNHTCFCVCHYAVCFYWNCNWFGTQDKFSWPESTAVIKQGNALVRGEWITSIIINLILGYFVCCVLQLLTSMQVTEEDI